MTVFAFALSSSCRSSASRSALGYIVGQTSPRERSARSSQPARPFFGRFTTSSTRAPGGDPQPLDLLRRSSSGWRSRTGSSRTRGAGSRIRGSSGWRRCSGSCRRSWARFVYMLFRPPEYLEDVRERELEIKAMEERLGRGERTARSAAPRSSGASSSAPSARRGCARRASTARRRSRRSGRSARTARRRSSRRRRSSWPRREPTPRGAAKPAPSRLRRRWRSSGHSSW